MNPLKWLINRFPPEKNDTAGWWIFRLPKDAEWIQRAAAIHDWEFENAKADGKRLSQVDVEFFDRLVLLAQNLSGDDYMERRKKYLQICKYFSIAKRAGNYFWDSPELKEDRRTRLVCQVCKIKFADDQIKDADDTAGYLSDVYICRDCKVKVQPILDNEGTEGFIKWWKELKEKKDD